MSLLYLDLDGFKQINDSLGHAVGDQLLQEVAARLKRCVRASDTVGRMGGDEFVVLLGDMQLPGYGPLVAEKMRQALGERFELAGHLLSISTSIGIACFPDNGEDGPQLIRHADEAMYAAKKAGGNRFQMSTRTGESTP